MADDTYTANALNQLTGLLSGAIEAQAMRPQKTSTTTSTTSTNTPYALADMIARRDAIGQATQELDDILKGRESYKYRLGQGLANVTPQDQSGAGWLSGFLRGVGGGLTGYTDNRAARAQQKYENEMKDLAQILAYDKAMGDTTRQIQKESITYTPVATGKVEENKEDVPIITPEYWDQMISNFDAGRPDEVSYRNQTQLARNLSNATTFAGDKNEAYARNILYSGIKGKKFMPMVRSALKGGGQISDYEDKKYSQWLEAAPQDPVGLKDVAVMIVNDYSTNHNLTPLQKNQVLESLGLTSEETQLLPQQVKHEPERVKSEEKSVDNILQKYGAKRVD